MILPCGCSFESSRLDGVQISVDELLELRTCAAHGRTHAQLILGSAEAQLAQLVDLIPQMLPRFEGIAGDSDLQRRLGMLRDAIRDAQARCVRERIRKQVREQRDRVTA